MRAPRSYRRVRIEAELYERLSPGEAGDILVQLPKDLKSAWEDA